MKKDIKRTDRITSTSEFTVGDIVDYVAKTIKDGANRGTIEDIVKGVVRPCAIDDGTVGGKTVLQAGIGGVVLGVQADGRGVTVAVPAGCGGSCPKCPAELKGSCRGQTTKGKIGSGTEAYELKAADKGASPKLATTSRYYNRVLQNGEVWSPYTNRRFLPAQYLGMMVWYKGNIDKAIACRYGFNQFLKLMEAEVENLVFMSKHWRTAFAERSQFLTVEDCRTIFGQYLTALEENLNNRGLCTFAKSKGTYHRVIQGHGDVTLWTVKDETKEGRDGSVTKTNTIAPSDWLVETNAAIEVAKRRVNAITDYADALKVLQTYLPRISMGTFKDSEGSVRTWLPKRWKECFKKAGAYYTLKSLVFNCHVPYTTEEGSWRHTRVNEAKSASEGLNRLKALIDPNVPAFVVHAILKKSISQAGLDLEAFLAKIGRR